MSQDKEPEGSVAGSYTDWKATRSCGKKSAHIGPFCSELTIVLRGGLIQCVYSTNPFTKVYLADYDILNHDTREYETRENAEERVAMGDMYEIY